MEDLISRQAAIDAVLWGITYAKAINKDTGEVMELFKQGNEELTKAVERLKKLPSVQPEHATCYLDSPCEYQNKNIALPSVQERKGWWIEQEDYNLDTYYDCSVCGESWCTIDGTPWENGMNYCPHCGAHMEGAEDDQIHRR